ncbi:hypothetical protein BGZ76_002675 [Entomortierella beljakovae]|nr:hypothetical protein BGZ76_002675 [Entomortierella beljakovae]
MTHPLQLHEIRARIGSFLESKDLIHCARVSKEWYSSFSNLIWHKLPREYFLINNLSQLNSLVIQPKTDNGGRHNFLLLSNLIKAHASTLKSLHWNGCQVSQKTFSILGECRQLTTVWLENITLPIDVLTALFDAFSTICLISENDTNLQSTSSKAFGVTTFYLGNVVFRKGHENIVMPLSQVPSLEHLHLHELHFLSSESCLSVLNSCRNILSFSWRGQRIFDKFPLYLWVEGIKSGFWPRLNSLDVQGHEFADYELSQAIDNIVSSLKILRAKGTGFGPESLESLLSADRHYNYIQELELFSCTEVTSSMIQKILMKMPALVYFSADILGASDILGTSDEHQDSREWVCINLRTLRLCIDMETDWDEFSDECREQQRKVHQRLATLEKLEILEVSRTVNRYSQGLKDRMLSHSLGNGLGYLSSLKRLREFMFSSSNQKFTMKEVEWTLNSWKSLALISWQENSDDELDDELAKKLSEHGIAVRYYY